MCFSTKNNTVFVGVRATDDKGGFLLRSTQGSICLVGEDSNLMYFSTKKNIVFGGVRSTDDKGGFLLRSTQGLIWIVDM
ncbi:hypothetical protein GCM10007987_15350 [Aliivibrio fischeri]|nr:hypothetical protein GCM10007987_15350 [Aliivibrio fischeri]